MKFKNLIKSIHQAHEIFQKRAVVSVNKNLILRNWLFGFFIVEFEQNGKDYAQYGENLLYRLAEELKKQGIKGAAYTNLTLFRKFYLYYPQFSQLVNNITSLPLATSNLQTVSEDLTILSLPIEQMANKFSFSHFIEFLKVAEPQKRHFYEIESIKGSWSVRQLRRQIGSLLYERTGLSNNKTTLLSKLKEQSKPSKPSEMIRDPYVFEFLGLKTKEVFQEKDLEKALLDHLQEFLLELGSGFCFEARQKSFLIDNRRYKIDLLFYHRILKCHVIIDLKMDAFTHEDAGQMNFYLNYFTDNEMKKDDNPPIGIILCTYKNETVVKYATGGVDNKLFVSRYLLQLPSEEELKQFILEEQKNLRT